MHIAAANPMAVSEADIPAAAVEKERTVLRATNLEQGKKPEMVDKIVDGQIKKWLAENCLLNQKFVMNPDITVADHLNNLVATIGENLVVRRFVRYELGEGIEKKNEDFAAEVSKHSGKPVKYVNQSEAEFAKTLEGNGLPPPVAALLASTSYLAGEGQLFNDERQLSKLSGRPTTPIGETIKAALG